MHKHHSTPVHEGGYGPIQLLPIPEHALVHAKRFLNGEDPWFHGSLLIFLDPDIQELVKAKMSALQVGEKHRNYGTKVWTDGEQFVFSKDSPGENFRPGIPDSCRNNISKSVSGMVFWNNGVDQLRSKECPGSGWKRGRLPWKDEHKKSFGNTSRGSRWWTNGETTKRSKNCPGPGWKPGRG